MKKISIALVIILALLAAVFYFYRSLAGPAVTVKHDPNLKSTEYSFDDVSMVIYGTDLNRNVISFYAKGEKPLGKRLAALGKVLDKVMADTGNLREVRTLAWGRMIGYPEMAERLSAAAKRSPGWNAKTGKPASGYVNNFVLNLANQENIYPELKELFAKKGFTVKVAGIEKVLVTEGTEKLPYDSQLWFKIEKR